MYDDDNRDVTLSQDVFCISSAKNINCELFARRDMHVSAYSEIRSYYRSVSHRTRILVET